MIVPFYKSSDKTFTLLHGNCIELLNSFDFKFDMIFADPPYHLSNGGISIQSGVPVSVDKGKWDKSQGFEEDYKFDKTWLAACREHLKSDGTIWVSGTYHNIFSVARCLTELDFKILNCITWVKTNPPPNLSCRYFTYSAEYILWARREQKVAHYFNYELMKEIMGVLRCATSGHYLQLPLGRNRVVSTLHKSRYVSFQESFRHPLSPALGYLTPSPAVVRQVSPPTYLAAGFWASIRRKSFLR